MPPSAPFLGLTQELNFGPSSWRQTRALRSSSFPGLPVLQNNWSFIQEAPQTAQLRLDTGQNLRGKELLHLPHIANRWLGESSTPTALDQSLGLGKQLSIHLLE